MNGSVLELSAAVWGDFWLPSWAQTIAANGWFKSKPYE